MITGHLCCPEVRLEEMWCYGVLLALQSPRTLFLKRKPGSAGSFVEHRKYATKVCRYPDNVVDLHLRGPLADSYLGYALKIAHINRQVPDVEGVAELRNLRRKEKAARRTLLVESVGIRVDAPADVTSRLRNGTQATDGPLGRDLRVCDVSEMV